MKIIIFILMGIFCTTLPLQGDTLFLKNGEQVNGELIALTSAGLIFEVRQDSTFLEFRTYPQEDVLRIVDPKKDLFNNNRLLVPYPSDYYDPPRNPYTEKTRRLYLFADVYDTLYLTDQSILVIKIQDISREFLSYTIVKESEAVQQIPLHQISRINGEPVDTYRRIFWSPPTERLISYPYLGIEVGFGKISTHFSKISDLTLLMGEQQEPYQFRSIEDNYTSLQLGFLVHINSYFTAAILGHYSSGFNGTTYEEEEEESFYLALAELRVGYPVSILNPWIGLGVAHQSLTLITNFPGVDAVWKSQSDGIAYSAGLELKVSSGLHPYISGHWLPFTSKQIVAADPATVDLSNLVISGGIKLVF